VQLTATDHDYHNCVNTSLSEISAEARAAACSKAIADPQTNDRTLSEAYSNRASMRLDGGVHASIDEIIADLDHALRLNPTLMQARYNRGKAYYRKGDYNRALADLNVAVGLDPGFAETHKMLSIVHRDLGKIDTAMDDITVSMRLNPNDAETLAIRGHLYSRFKQQQDLAIADLTAAIRIAPNYEIAHLTLANAYFLKSDYVHAISEYDATIRLNPNELNALEYRDACYSMDLNPRDPHTLNQRGLIYLELNDLDRALADLNEAIRLKSDYAMAYKNRSKVYAARGDRARADADLAEAIRLDPEISRL